MNGKRRGQPVERIVKWWERRDLNIQELEAALDGLGQTEPRKTEDSIRQAFQRHRQASEPALRPKGLSSLRAWLASISILALISLLGVARLAVFGSPLAPTPTPTPEDRSIVQTLEAVDAVVTALQAQIEEQKRAFETQVKAVVSLREAITKVAALEARPTPTPTPTPTMPTSPTPMPSPTPTVTTSSTSIPSPTPTMTTPPTPTPSPTSLLSLGVQVTPPSGAQATPIAGATVGLFGSGNGQDWTSLANSCQGACTFNVILPPAGLYCRVLITPTKGLYISTLTPPQGPWQVITNTITGFPQGIQSTSVISYFSGTLNCQLERVPTIEAGETKGKIGEKKNTRPLPTENGDIAPATGTIQEESAQLLGLYDNKWVLCHIVTETILPIVDCYWTHSINITGTTGTLQHLPAVYLPKEYDLKAFPSPTPPPTPPGGWKLVSFTDQKGFTTSISVLEAQGGGSTWLTWQLGKLEGWFKLETWQAKGGAAATYKVVAIQENQQEIELQPLDSDLQVSKDNKGRFKEIGTYYLKEETEVIVKLPPGNGVRAMVIRVKRPPSK